MRNRLLPWFFLPVWLLIMIAVAGGGLYLGFKRPDIALAIVFLFMVGAWIFWSSWHDLVRR